MGSLKAYFKYNLETKQNKSIVFIILILKVKPRQILLLGEKHKMMIFNRWTQFF